jgi:hypothetical protein
VKNVRGRKARGPASNLSLGHTQLSSIPQTSIINIPKSVDEQPLRVRPGNSLNE